MQPAPRRTTIPYAGVILDMKGIHLHPAAKRQLLRQQLQKFWIPATPRHVDPMLCATTDSVLLPASVYLNTLETHMWPVGLNVLSTQTVPPTRPASGYTVLIHAPEFVVSMLNVMLGTIFLRVPVGKHILEIPLLNADFNLRLYLLLLKKILVYPTHVVTTQVHQDATATAVTAPACQE
jgi:hypothetical protein